jgi:hypothetical protein
MNLCAYSNMFGKPNSGLHQYRIYNIAIIDTILVFIVAGLFYYFHKKINYSTYVIILFIMGIFFHRLFCVRTTIDKLIFD